MYTCSKLPSYEWGCCENAYESNLCSYLFWNVWFCVIFKHAHVQMHSLYLRNTSMAAKSASEKQGGVGVKAPHLTVVCPFPWQCNLVWYSLYLLLCYPAQLSAPISPHSQAPSLHCLLTISPNFSPCFFFPCLPSPMYGMLRVLREHLWVLDLVFLEVAFCCIYSSLLQ